MATATKDRPATVSDLLQPKPASVDIDAHQADLARRQAEMDSQREELIKCCNPFYARQRELQKPVFVWTIEADWYSAHPDQGMINFTKKSSVVAQNEQAAWAMFCDKIGVWPSRRDAKVKFKRGKQLSAEQVAAANIDNVDNDIPRREFKSKNETAWPEL